MEIPIVKPTIREVETDSTIRNCYECWESWHFYLFCGTFKNDVSETSENSIVFPKFLDFRFHWIMLQFSIIVEKCDFSPTISNKKLSYASLSSISISSRIFWRHLHWYTVLSFMLALDLHTFVQYDLGFVDWLIHLSLIHISEPTRPY